MKKYLILVLIILIAGCYPKLHLKQTLPEKNVKLKVDTVEVVDNAEIEPLRVAVFSSYPTPLCKSIQHQFHEAVVKTLKLLILPTAKETGRKAIININKAVIMKTTNPLKQLPILGILALPIKEEFIAIIDGDIEIENRQGQVISRADFHVFKNKKAETLTQGQLENAASQVTNEALLTLQQTIIKQSQRYLTNFLF